MKTTLIVLTTFFLFGCANTPTTNTALIPIGVSPSAVIKTKLPERPVYKSSMLNVNSSDDDVIKAAIQDLNSCREYSNSLERLINQ